MKRSLKASDNHSPVEGEWLEALPLAALLTDASLLITYANSAAQEFAAELKTADIAVALGELHPLSIALMRARNDGRTTHLRAITIGNTEITAWVTPFTGGQVLVLLDVTGTKETEHFTQVSATMAAMLAHEIRNPLLSMKGAAQLLKQSANAEDVPLCDLIAKEVDRVEQLIATLDPLSPTPTKVMAPLNIHEVLEHARLATAAAFPAVTFVMDYDPSLPQVVGDRDALVQAMLNLLKNAAEAVVATAQPTITLSSRYALGEKRRHASGKSLPLAIGVADNGPGIDPTIRDRLFAPFTTTKANGKGLGLAVCAKITEEHSGLILAEPAPSGGARFTLYLPIA